MVGFLIHEVYALFSLGSLASHFSALVLCLFIVYFMGKYLEEENRKEGEDEDEDDRLRLF
jgi:hypothetical protein